ncbi:MAG: 3-hydroxyacyl-CoA dehydrogenase NAD-binding domain-containing protein [Longimicrobiales bacterium]
MTSTAVSDDQAALTLELLSDGVAWLVFDRAESRVNLLSEGVMTRLDALLDEIERAAHAQSVHAVIVRSGKDGSFIAGADVNVIGSITDPAEAEAKARRGQRLFRRLERLPVPTIAAVDGVCLGGGTELILACSYRLASERPETSIGLPEVQLGIIPGFGGTTRLPRLVGLRAAFDMILTGRAVNARKAQRIGLVDEAVPIPALYTRAEAVARAFIHGRPPERHDRRNLAMRALEVTPPGRRILFDQARKQVMKQTKGHYPAPLAALSVMKESVGKPIDEALDIEARAVGTLIAGDVSKNLIHVFHLMEAAKKASPEGAEPRAVERAAVVGAGVMGGGIAQLLAAKGVAVRMKDIQQDALASGLRHAREIFDKAVQRRRLQRREAAHAMQRIAPTLDYSGFAQADLVIEAVVERMGVKQQVLAEVEDRTRARCVITTNTSSLSVTEMQSTLARPANFCGMHFFNPVHRMPLVEVIRGAMSSDDAVATVFALARTLGKTPIIVEDGPGFLVNRILAPYLNEAGWLLADGASIEAVDRVLTRFGMPMGPLRLLDEVGFDVARHAAQTMHESFGERLAPSPPLVALEHTKMLGRKGGLGFYVYEHDEEKSRNDALYDALGAAVPAERSTLGDAEIRDRAVLVMVNEAARVLEDGIVRGPGDVDLGMITGTGFPPFRGGLLRYADSRGLASITQRLQGLAERLGPRFAPASLLREYAQQGRGFYAAHTRA